MTDLEAAWDRLHDATPAGWYVGQPSHHDERNYWLMYAFDATERPAVGRPGSVSNPDGCCDDERPAVF